jgi:hypothetical protein
MALSAKAQSRIKKALDRYKARTKLRTIGAHALSPEEIRDLVASGFIKGLTDFSAPVVEAYIKTHVQHTGGVVAPRSTQEGAMKWLEKMMERYIDKAGDQLAADVQSSIEGTLMPIIDRREGKVIYEALKDPDIYKKNLRSLLREKVENWDYRWKTIVNTELNRASNWGSMDAILHNNAGVTPENITVYKVGNEPGHGACKYCAKFWYEADGKTPKVYRLSELIANGSNIGRKAKDWLPTVDGAHPNETHTLHELKPGYGFVNGEIEFIGEGHDELKKQRGNLKP